MKEHRAIECSNVASCGGGQIPRADGSQTAGKMVRLYRYNSHMNK